jgi:integrase
VKPALPKVSLAVRAMVKLQLLTGMRPGEVVILRGCDIDRSRPIWEYRPSIYKTEHVDQERVVYLGPKAQAILKAFLQPDPDAYLFSPKKANRLRKRRVNDHYSVDTYLQAIQYGCARAGIPAFTPLQLRHTAATRIRKRHGIEMARIILGHSTAFTTEIYAEADRARAVEIMGEMG